MTLNPKKASASMTMNGDDSSFGAFLKALRTRAHLTQHQLAQALGIHRITLIRWEQGDYLPESKALVLELARYLHLDHQETRLLLEASLTALAPYWFVPGDYGPLPTMMGQLLILATSGAL